jgi:hypothetical protein
MSPEMSEDHKVKCTENCAPKSSPPRYRAWCTCGYRTHMKYVTREGAATALRLTHIEDAKLRGGV